MDTKGNLFYENGGFKWYESTFFSDYLINKQAENLPALENLGCFIVINELESISDYVLINNNQEIISAYKYSHSGFEQMQAKINIIKIAKHYDDFQ